MKRKIIDYITYFTVIASILSPVMLASGVNTGGVRERMTSRSRQFVSQAFSGSMPGSTAAVFVDSLNRTSLKPSVGYSGIAERITPEFFSEITAFLKTNVFPGPVSASGNVGEELGDGLEGKIVIIDPGHGGNDPGSSSGSLMEKDLTMDMALRLEKIIESEGGRVIMTRREDSFHSLLNRSATANKFILQLELERLLKQAGSIEASAGAQGSADSLSSSGGDKISTENYQALIEDISKKISMLEEYTSNPGLGRRQGIFSYSNGNGYPGMIAGRELIDIFEMTGKRYGRDIIFISIHVNLYDGGGREQSEVSGVQVYYRDNESKDYGVNKNYYKNYNKADRERLGKSILESINQISSFQQKWRDLYEGDISVLRENNLISALVEVGFINNPADRRILSDEAERQKISEAIGKGILNYFENGMEKPHQ